jgi:enoyl-CoA hydratase/carnithine racemase
MTGVDYTVAGQVATITVNRPEHMNAILLSGGGRTSQAGPG